MYLSRAYIANNILICWIKQFLNTVLSFILHETLIMDFAKLLAFRNTWGIDIQLGEVYLAVIFEWQAVQIQVFGRLIRIYNVCKAVVAPKDLK